MSFLKPFRKLYIKSTDFTHSYQGKDKKLIGLAIKYGDTTLDIGCGTGISTLYASEIADKVIGIDLSADMMRKLEQKISRKKSVNIKVITGRFPEALPKNIKFDSIISSFAIVHFTPKQRKSLYNLLLSGGRLGLFSAQGEIASSFETKNEIVSNLELAGFNKIETNDVSDIYRIVTAEKQ